MVLYYVNFTRVCHYKKKVLKKTRASTE
uniref:Uncharacterized protein n=1 Tax=Arundo donax TaxID=35708 RepID=A0A0A9HQ64_ARUDO